MVRASAAEGLRAPRSGRRRSPFLGGRTPSTLGSRGSVHAIAAATCSRRLGRPTGWWPPGGGVAAASGRTGQPFQRRAAFPRSEGGARGARDRHATRARCPRSWRTAVIHHGHAAVDPLRPLACRRLSGPVRAGRRSPRRRRTRGSSRQSWLGVGRAAPFLIFASPISERRHAADRTAHRPSRCRATRVGFTEDAARLQCVELAFRP